MIYTKDAFSGFSVNDLAKAKEFYTNILGLKVTVLEGMGINLHINENHKIFVYEKPNHQPAIFTILNFPVENIDKTIDELESKGVKFEHYDEGDFQTDENGVLRGLAANMGPDIAWFKDPAGNIISILQDK